MSITLLERINYVCQIQGNRFSHLKGIQLEIATAGIIRHLVACMKMEINPDSSAIREIIDYAKLNLNITELANKDETDLVSL